MPDYGRLPLLMKLGSATVEDVSAMAPSRRRTKSRQGLCKTRQVSLVSQTYAQAHAPFLDTLQRWSGWVLSKHAPKVPSSHHDTYVLNPADLRLQLREATKEDDVERLHEVYPIRPTMSPARDLGRVGIDGAQVRVEFCRFPARP